MFIVIEGIDGAGKGRQRTELVEHLSKRGVSFETTDFPDHKSTIYKKIIHPALHQEIEIDSKSLFLSFALDQILWKNNINKSVGKSNHHFISDGYFTTTLAYQCYLQNTLPIDEAIRFAEDFEIPEPDLVIFIDVDPKVAMSRKADEEGHEEGFDMFEADIKKQEVIRSAFLDLANDQVFGSWQIIDGSNSIKDVFGDILRVLSENKINF